MIRKFIYLALVAITAFTFWKMQPQRVTADGEAMVRVVVPELSPQASEGKALFDENCAACHGVNAAGVNGSGPPLINKIYEPSHHGDGAFLLAAKNGVRAHHWRFGNMPPVEGISNEEVLKIVTYVRELQKANNIF